MVGPSPYKYASFRELRAVLGRPYLVCRPCRRFVALGKWLDGRDSRTTTFSCSACGGEGEVVLEDPAREGLQHDPRPNPPRHRLAFIRLRAMHQLAAAGAGFGRREAPRESRPPTSKPHYERAPKFLLKPMPFRTFGELLPLALALVVHCPGCHAQVPVEIGERLAPHRWGRVRFTCRRTRYNGTPCGSRGHLYLKPVAPLDPDTQLVSMECARCLPPWFAQDVQLERFPWSSAPIDTSRERYRCPGCGGQVRATFHGKPDRSGPVASHLLAPPPTF